MKYIMLALGYIATLPLSSAAIRLLRAPSDVSFYLGAAVAVGVGAWLIFLTRLLLLALIEDLH